MKHHFWLSPTIAILLSAMSTLAATPEASSTNRPSSWAQPLQQAGVPNFFQITSNLYRSAQPTAEGMKQLDAMGIKTVISFRSMHDDKDEAKGTKLNLISIPMKAWKPTTEDAVQFLKIATDTNNFPILFHCQHGADRTGLMSAIYRVAVQGWSKEEAGREMAEGGFGFHSIWQNIIEFLQELNITAIQNKANLATPHPQEQ